MEKSLQIRSLAGRIILITCILSIGYAVLRYHILGPVPWKDLPFFILNKGIALSAFVLLTFNFSFGPLKNLGVNVPAGLLDARKALGMTGFLLVLIHSFMSFLLFKSDVYGKFFQQDGTLTLIGGLSMLGGVLSFVILWVYSLSFITHLRDDEKFIKAITSENFLLPVMLFGLIHIFFLIGYVINLLGRK